jgi:hypothetical protein
MVIFWNREEAGERLAEKVILSGSSSMFLFKPT